MGADTLRIGEFEFEVDDLPEEIPLGGSQQLQVIKFPGGYREVQVFGAQEDTISWNGTLNFSNAVDKMETLDAMYKSGSVYMLQVGVLKPMNVIISSFKPTYRSQYEIPYSISLEIAPTASLLIPSGSSTDTGTQPTAPAANAPSPQQSYVVQQGDTLWRIAARQLGDGTRYRDIANLNPQIADPNNIQVGWKLVLPT